MMAAVGLVGYTLASRELGGIFFLIFSYKNAWKVASHLASKVNSSCIFLSVCQKKWSTTCSHALCNAI